MARVTEVQTPAGFVVRTEAQKAAADNGYRLERGEESGWLRFGSTTAPGDVWIAGASDHGPWFISIDHTGVAAEMGESGSAAPIIGPGIATYFCQRLTGLYSTLDRIFKLSVSLPDAPLRRFQARTAGMPRSTEAERLVVQRIGQDVFRDALLEYWGHRCPLTGIVEPELLRASHIRPWAECTDEERLDVHNGLLLSALWDAAFDKGLVSFADDGTPLASPRLTDAAKRALSLPLAPKIAGLREQHLENLAAHRARHRFTPAG